MLKYLNVLEDAAGSSLNFCDNYNILSTFYLIKIILTLICIVVPIALIVMLIIDVFKIVVAGSADDEMKKFGKKASKRLIFCVGFFLLPSVINLFTSYIVKTINYNASMCWLNANKEYIVQLKTERDNASKNSDEEAKNKQTEEENKKNQESDELKNKLDNDLKDKKEKEKQDAQNNSSDGSYDNTNVQTNGKVIFLGDSRTVGLEYIGKNDPNTYFVCEGGMGYNWFLTTGIMRVNQIALTDGYTILFNLGVNGTVLKDKINENQAKGYVSKIKELANGLWSKHKIVIVSVFPINEETNKYAVNNNGVVLFNNYMKDNLQGISNVSYCDVYNGLDRSKFIDSGDGLHFSSDGYRNIYNYMKQNCV